MAPNLSSETRSGCDRRAIYRRSFSSSGGRGADQLRVGLVSGIVVFNEGLCYVIVWAMFYTGSRRSWMSDDRWRSCLIILIRSRDCILNYINTKWAQISFDTSRICAQIWNKFWFSALKKYDMQIMYKLVPVPNISLEQYNSLHYRTGTGRRGCILRQHCSRVVICACKQLVLVLITLCWHRVCVHTDGSISVGKWAICFDLICLHYLNLKFCRQKHKKDFFLLLCPF